MSWFTTPRKRRQEKEKEDEHRQRERENQHSSSEGTFSNSFTRYLANAKSNIAPKHRSAFGPVPREGEGELTTITPVWGLRGWGQGETYGYHNPYVLSALNGQFGSWCKGVNRAKCFCQGGARGHNDCSYTGQDPPGLNCGFYAASTLNNFYEEVLGRYSPSVLGAVVGWGKVAIGDIGWRAEKAMIAAIVPRRYPDRLGLNDETLTAIAKAYGVPVVRTIPLAIQKAQQKIRWMAGQDLLEGGENLDAGRV